MNIRASLPAPFAEWIAASANGIDTGAIPSSSILPRLVEAELVGIGVPRDMGGLGGDIAEGVAAIAAVAEESLAAAFVLWGHRSYIELLLRSDARQLREQSLPDLLAGKVAGASALSNVMKFLVGMEPLQISSRIDGDFLVLDGKMPWVTNLRRDGFQVAAAVDNAQGGNPIIVSLHHDDIGLERSDDLDLLGMRSTDTAAISLSGVRIGKERIIAGDAGQWLPTVRPAFAGLQCGMSIGLARRAVTEAEKETGAGGAVLAEPIAELKLRLGRAEASLFAGLRSGSFVADAPSLFDLRIAFADMVAEAVLLELQASGGRAYLAGPGDDFARRWREAAFIPVVTPSIVQLKTTLRKVRENASG